MYPARPPILFRKLLYFEPKRQKVLHILKFSLCFKKYLIIIKIYIICNANEKSNFFKLKIYVMNLSYGHPNYFEAKSSMLVFYIFIFY
jgi:hypothetical protein